MLSQGGSSANVTVTKSRILRNPETAGVLVMDGTYGLCYMELVKYVRS
jgi:hypothetical protein